MGLKCLSIFRKTIGVRYLLLVLSKLAFASDRTSLPPPPQMGTRHLCTVGQLGSMVSKYTWRVVGTGHSYCLNPEQVRFELGMS